MVKKKVNSQSNWRTTVPFERLIENLFEKVSDTAKRIDESQMNNLRDVLIVKTDAGFTAYPVWKSEAAIIQNKQLIAELLDKGDPDQLKLLSETLEDVFKEDQK